VKRSTRPTSLADPRLGRRNRLDATGPCVRAAEAIETPDRQRRRSLQGRDVCAGSRLATRLSRGTRDAEMGGGAQGGHARSIDEGTLHTAKGSPVCVLFHTMC
jgi:hypothetical protein